MNQHIQTLAKIKEIKFLSEFNSNERGLPIVDDPLNDIVEEITKTPYNYNIFDELDEITNNEITNNDIVPSVVIPIDTLYKTVMNELSPDNKEELLARSVDTDSFIQQNLELSAKIQEMSN